MISRIVLAAAALMCSATLVVATPVEATDRSPTSKCARVLDRRPRAEVEAAVLRLDDVFEVSARTTRHPATKATVVCAWRDTDADGRWDRGEPLVQALDRRGVWAPISDGRWRSAYSTSLTIDGAESDVVCVQVGRRTLAGWWMSGPACDTPPPPVEIPEVPIVPLLGASALGMMSLVAWRGRRRTA